jgi:hypothetical protein
MCTVKQIKDVFLNALEEKYGQAKKEFEPISPQNIEHEGFMCQEHAEGILGHNHSYYVSFREAGKNTLDRIREGNPCKGHKILDKSIKEIKGSWTYKSPEIPGFDFNTYKGLVGHPNPGTKDAILEGIWKYTKGIPDHALIYFKPEEPVTEEDIKLCYTGDYDMHDLIKQDKTKILATTPEEQSSIDYINSWMLQGEEETKREGVRKGWRKEEIDKMLNSNPKARMSSSPYALIRHGAQTSFIDYMLSFEGKDDLEKQMSNVNIKNLNPRLPAEETIVTVASKILIFKPGKRGQARATGGNAYLLSTVEDIYLFFKAEGMVDKIPFYYFTSNLRENIPVPDMGSYIKRLDEIFLASLTYLLKLRSSSH